eukprot:7180055-Pyramimonas_sp.AAC.1
MPSNIRRIFPVDRLPHGWPTVDSGALAAGVLDVDTTSVSCQAVGRERALLIYKIRRLPVTLPALTTNF